MEANSRNVPTVERLQAQYQEAVEKLQKALPTINLVPVQMHAALAVLDGLRPKFERERNYLQQVAPVISAPVSHSKLQATWDKVLAVADRNGVPRSSLVVLACLSVVAIPKGRSSAKTLLKLRAQYTPKEAYNALADLRSLEFLIALFAMDPTRAVQLWTKDKDLALFWAGIQATNFRRISKTELGHTLSPITNLIPASMLTKWRDAIREASLGGE